MSALTEAMINRFLRAVIISSLLVLEVFLSLGAQRDRTYFEVTVVQIERLHQALEQYHVDMGAYPADDLGFTALLEAPPLPEKANWYGPYIDSKPLDAWNHDFVFHADNSTVTIVSCGQDEVCGSSDDILRGSKYSDPSARVLQILILTSLLQIIGRSLLRIIRVRVDIPARYTVALDLILVANIIVFLLYFLMNAVS